MKLNKILFCAAMTSILPLQHAFSAPVNSVEVQVIDVNGGTSQLLLQKMSDSMQVVADQLFIDKDTAMIAAAGEDYARLLTEIGDRVFTGYELTDVKLAVGETTQVKLYARPWNKVIEKPLIDLQFSGVEPQTAALLERRIPALHAQPAVADSGAVPAGSLGEADTNLDRGGSRADLVDDLGEAGTQRGAGTAAGI